MPKTEFRTQYGHYEFLVTPSGVKHSIGLYGFDEPVFSPYLKKFIVVFIDVILIYSKNEEHKERLRIVLQTLRQGKLYYEMKCDFWLKSMAYLGHVISGDGISINPDKVKEVETGKL